MTATYAGSDFVGKDSGQDFGDSELLEGLIEEVNSSLARLAEFDLQMSQESGADSAEADSHQDGNLLYLLPRAEMEDIAKRVRAIEGLLS